MAALRELVASFDVRINGANKLDQVDRQINRVKNSANRAIFSFGKLGAALAGAFAIRGIAHFFRQQADLGLQLESNAALTGLSVEQLQRWQYAANLAGEPTEALTNGLHHFNRAIGMAGTQQGKMYAEALGQMGLQVHDLHGKMKPTQELLLEFADALHKTKDPQTRMGMAMQLAGRGGKVFVDILSQGREATEKWLKQADEAGVVLGRGWAENAKKAEFEGIKLDWSWRALKATLAGELFPWFKKIVDMATKFVKAFIDVIKHTTFAKTAFIALGAAIAIANWEFIAVAAAVAAAYLVFDDLFDLFSGNKSLIGDTIDELSGAGTSTDFVKSLKDAWDDVTNALFGTGDAADQAGQSMSFIGVVKATIAQTVLIVGSALATIADALAVVIQTARSAWNAITGDTKGQRAADVAQFKAVQDLKKSFGDLGTYGSFANVKSANDMTLEEWNKLNGTHNDIYGHPMARNRKPISVTTQQAGKPPVTITQHITIHGGEPNAVRAAIKHGTGDALSQTDLRHTYHAVRSNAPAVGQ